MLIYGVTSAHKFRAVPGRTPSSLAADRAAPKVKQELLPPLPPQDSLCRLCPSHPTEMVSLRLLPTSTITRIVRVTGGFAFSWDALCSLSLCLRIPHKPPIHFARSQPSTPISCYHGLFCHISVVACSHRCPRTSQTPSQTVAILWLLKPTV